MLVTGHPYIDIWQAVRPAAVGIAAWPTVPRGVDWKTGVCAALGLSDTGGAVGPGQRRGPQLTGTWTRR